MNIPEPVIEEWRENVSYCIGKMDERGCSNPENNSQMLWNIEWEELRNELWRCYCDPPPINRQQDANKPPMQMLEG